MEKLKMQSHDVIGSNTQKIAQLFPHCVTEILGKDGKPQLAIDFEKLQAELSNEIIGEGEERYQFTWPDKRAANRLANTPTTMTLRPCREESVDFDNTQNLYIEGDNLDVLKVLRETYLGKVKMIYIDPPYNTGNDFVYNDDFAQSKDDFEQSSGLFDEEGNQTIDPMQRNTESNGRFHTDWLNMIYPRLKVARDLLTEDGAILIHIDEHEVAILESVCKEIFGAYNYLGTIVWDKRNPKGVVAGVAYQHESILAFCKNITEFTVKTPFLKEKENAKTMLSMVEGLIRKYNGVTDTVRDEYKEWIKKHKNELSGGERAYSLIDDNGDVYRPVSMAAPDKPETRSHRPLIHPVTGKPCPTPVKGWRFIDKTMDKLLEMNKIEFGKDESTQPNQKYFLRENMTETVSSLLYFGGSDTALNLPFDNPKPVYVAQRLVNSIAKNNDIVLDFFSGSATTAHAVMKLNAEDGGNRKFIMVQLPEKTDEKSEAYKAGYENICEIGKERIRRAGKKVKEENAEKDGIDKLDIGFRVLKLDSSNMNDVYYTPQQFNMQDLFEENIKLDRTAEDLLFQVMLEHGIELSAKIETKQVNGKKVHFVDENYLITCFDADVNESTITEIAKLKPIYFVMRDSSANNDNVIDNFEQIFRHYSPETTCKII
jgi:adenine-specific DNA-methyltransferase